MDEQQPREELVMPVPFFLEHLVHECVGDDGPTAPDRMVDLGDPVERSAQLASATGVLQER
ncbi:hypothetical protein [Streptomyces fodineus]|uniref:hypothetical protein n=1 Tax=Streptomyces fodineus TaxID=1904616 RepID=UPI00131B4EF1